MVYGWFPVGGWFVTGPPVYEGGEGEWGLPEARHYSSQIFTSPHILSLNEGIFCFKRKIKLNNK
jgi:hypothetical protein